MRVRRIPLGRDGWIVALFCLLAGVLSAQEGTKRWAVNVQGFITLSSPALSPDGNTIYVGVERSGSGRVVAVRADGVTRWDKFLAEPVDSSPAVGPDGTIYVGCVDGFLYALNPLNGGEKWRFNALGFITSSPAIGADGTIYVGSSAGILFAINPENGTRRWAFTAGDRIDSSPAIAADGTIYFGSDDQNLYAVTPAGEKLWQFPTGAPIFGSPAIGADGTIYIGSGDQRMYAVFPDSTLNWSFFTNGDIQSSPVLAADGTIYFASSDAFFYALNPGGSDELRVKWRTDIRATTASTAAVRADGVIIFGADDDKVRALDPEGKIRWVFGTNDDVESSPLVAPDGSIYIGSFDGFLYKINGNGSPLSALSNWPAFRRDTRHTGRALAAGRGQVLNLSTRAEVGAGSSVVVGFFVLGSSAKAYLIRGIGPALTQFGIPNAMTDPRIDLFTGRTPLASNDNWNVGVPGLSVPDTSARVGAFPLSPGSKDAALVAALPPGLYTAVVSNVEARAGVALVEAYDAIGGDPSARLVNVSTLGPVGASRENYLVAGVSVGGTMPSRLLIRGIGPGLAQFGVSNVLMQPSMAVYAVEGNTAGRLLGTNAGWTKDGLRNDFEVAAASVAAFALVPGSLDAAMLVTVAPGNYTVEIAGVNQTSGQALVEIYVLP